MSEIYLVITQQGLIPASEDDWVLLRKHQAGSVVKIKLKRVRNYRHLKKYMALIAIAFDNQDRYDNFEMFRKAVKIAAGWCDIIIGPEGQSWLEPRSIAFENMEQDEFDIHYEEVIRTLLSRFLTNWDDWHIRQAAERIALA